jgi:L-aspartate oxidase
LLSDLEFVQFHPTALAVGDDPMPLISEAVRGEGAVLVDAQGDRFMAGQPGGDLAPRDVLARAVFRQWSDGGRAALDVRHWPPGKFAERFPTIYRVLIDHGLDPAVAPVPVRPAAHYHMGGVRADANGRTSIAGLWACGEVACTGFHGANRLASNSLLEAVVCGRWAAQDIAGAQTSATTTSLFAPEGELPEPPPSEELIPAMRALMDDLVGVIRDQSGLSRAVEELAALSRQAAGTVAAGPLAAALLIALAAARRRESRGAHWRADAGSGEPPAHSVSQWSDLAALGIEGC